MAGDGENDGDDDGRFSSRARAQTFSHVSKYERKRNKISRFIPHDPLARIREIRRKHFSSMTVTLQLPQAAMLVHRVQVWHKCSRDNMLTSQMKIDSISVFSALDTLREKLMLNDMISQTTLKLSTQSFSETYSGLIKLATAEMETIESAIKRVHGIDDVKLTDYKVTQLGPEASIGFASETKRVNLKYEQDLPGLPSSLIVKSVGAFSETFMQMCKEINAYQREHDFYSKVQPLIAPTLMRIPRVYESRSDQGGNGKPGSGATYILMEDLGPIATGGDQLKGLSYARARSLVESAANLHATFWQGTVSSSSSHVKHPIPPCVIWGKQPDSFLSKLRTHFVDHYHIFVQTGGFRGLDVGVDEEKVLRIGEFLFNNADTILHFTCGGTPQTLIHADYRAGNVMLMNDSESECAVLDWQTCTTGNGLYDIVGILVASMTVSDISEHCVDLLKVYQARLAELGVEDYLDFNRLWDDFRICILQLGFVFIYLLKDTVDENGTANGSFADKEALSLFRCFYKRMLTAILQFNCTKKETFTTLPDCPELLDM